MQIQIHNHNVLDSDKIGRLLMKLTVPLFFGSLIQAIYSIADTIFVGHYVGRDGLAALSIIMPVQLMTMGAWSMIGLGGASLISRLLGRNEQQNAERALGNSILFALIFSAVLAVAIVVFMSFWLKLIGTSANVMPYARDYLTITISGAVFNITGNVLLAMARAEGNARVSMVSLILQSVLNIILDAVFMIALKMGIAGAATATVISQGVGLIYMLFYYLSGESYLKLRWRNFIPDLTIVKGIFAIGLSQLFMTIANCIAGLTLVRMVNSYGGDIALSAFGIAQRIITFASMPSMVMGQAMQPILGFNYGARRFRQALRSIKLASISGTAVGVVALSILLLFPGPIISIFTSDPELIVVTASASRLMFLGLPLYSFFNVGQLVFPSVGKALPTLIISVTRPLLFMTPIALFLPRFIGINGVWLSFPGSDVLGTALVVVLLIPLIIKFRKAAAENIIQAPLS